MASLRITAEFTNLPADKFEEVTAAILRTCDYEARFASRFPNHPNLADHSLVEVDVTATTVFGGVR